MITMAAMLAGSAWAGAKSEGQRLVVCIEDGKHAGVAEAAGKAAHVLLSAGVKLDWHGNIGFCDRQRDSIVVSLSESTPKAFHPSALAYALPYEGVHIQVFYERIAGADPELVPSLLAYVIVHEISHILQGVDRHSKSGIMKAKWTSSDYTLMKRGQLRFTPLDVEIIRAGFAARAARSAGGGVVAAVAP